MQRVTPKIGDAFIPVEQALMNSFIPDLLKGLGEGTTGRRITRLYVKQAGLTLPKPTNTAPEKWMASCAITGHLVVALRVQEEFRTADHLDYL